MIKVYGTFRSRAARCLWMLEELGLPHQLVETPPRSEATRSPEFLALNPNARVPVLVDGDLVLWESMAINLYLADKYDGGLKPAAMEDRARATQWSFWAMTEMEAETFRALSNRVLKAPEERDAALADAAEQALQRPLTALNQALEGRTHLVGNKFSVADLNVGAVMGWAKIASVNLEPFPHLTPWLLPLLARPAFLKGTGRG